VVRPVPTVLPARGFGEPLSFDDFDDDDGDEAVPVGDPLPDEDEAINPTAPLIGLALLPFGIPLLWLVAPLLSGVESVFSFAVPVAVAVGVAGLCLGVVATAVTGKEPVFSWGTPFSVAVGFSALCLGLTYTRDFSRSTRLKGVLALVGLAYFITGTLYFLKQDWVEELKKALDRGEGRWVHFQPPDRAYQVRMPNEPAQVPAGSVPGWNLTEYQCEEQRPGGTDVYAVAHGTDPNPPNRFRKDDDAQWFKDLIDAVARGANGNVTDERKLFDQGRPAREYLIAVPAFQTTRVVRVYRDHGLVVYLAVEGRGLSFADDDVKRFFGSLIIPGRK
jgi:hypothetical protein